MPVFYSYLGEVSLFILETTEYGVLTVKGTDRPYTLSSNGLKTDLFRIDFLYTMEIQWVC